MIMKDYTDKVTTVFVDHFSAYFQDLVVMIAVVPLVERVIRVTE